MSEGFNKLRVNINKEEFNKIIRKYKNAKRYMKSGIFAVRTMNGTENYISGLLKENNNSSPMN
jgi:hypothetical protein